MSAPLRCAMCVLLGRHAIFALSVMDASGVGRAAMSRSFALPATRVGPERVSAAREWAIVCSARLFHQRMCLGPCASPADERSAMLCIPVLRS